MCPFTSVMAPCQLGCRYGSATRQEQAAPTTANTSANIDQRKETGYGKVGGVCWWWKWGRGWWRWWSRAPMMYLRWHCNHAGEMMLWKKVLGVFEWWWIVYDPRIRNIGHHYTDQNLFYIELPRVQWEMYMRCEQFTYLLCNNLYIIITI